MEELLNEILSSEVPDGIKYIRIRGMNVQGNDKETKLINTTLNKVDNYYSMIQILKDYFINKNYENALNTLLQYL